MHRMQWNAMLMMTRYADEHIETYRMDLRQKLFYKVVHIIQDYSLIKQVIIFIL
jgi:hypothetical protein